ncbi:MAG: hypothetical protein AB7J35_20715 [Dehalococcoidia bacterium]
MAKIYRGIVVVHGVGEHSKGSYVSGFVEQLANYLGGIPEFAHSKVELTARNRSDTSDTSWATIHIKNPDTTRPDEEWHIREAWWTRTFEPSNPGRIYLWAVLAGLALLWSACVQQFGRGLLAFFDPARLAKWPSERIGRPFDRQAHTHLPETDQGVWRQPGAGRLKSILDAIIWFVLTALFIAVGFVGILVIGVVYLVLVLPVSLLFPEFANKIVRAMIRIIVFTLGDQEAMTTRQVALAAAANEVNAGLWNMLSKQGLLARKRDDLDFAGFETVTVVAHSGGCVVSMAALKSVDFDQFRTESLPATLSRPAYVNWVTAGSGLNLAWNVRFGETASDTGLWEKPLERINWLNFYARYDPVPQGPTPVELAADLLGADPEANPLPPEPPPAPGAPPPAPRPPFVGMRVANTDSPWADHSGYWGNHPEVMSRVVHAVTDSRLASGPISPEQRDIGSKNLQALETAITQQVESGIARRREKVTRHMLIILGGLAAFVVVGAIWAGDAGRWVLGTDGFLGMDPWAPGGHQLESVVTKKFASIGIEGMRDRVIGLAVIGFAALIAVEYIRLFTWLWDFSSRRNTRRRKVLWFAASATILLSTYALLDLLLVRWPTGALG